MRLRFRERLQVGITILAAVFVGAAATGLGTLTDHFAAGQSEEQIRAGRASFRMQMQQVEATLRSEAGFLAQTSWLLAVAAIPDVDAATFEDVFDGIQRAFDEPILAVFDRDGRIVAERGGAFRVGDALDGMPGLDAVRAGEVRDALWPGARGPCLVGLAPLVQAGELLGGLVIGQPIDARFAARIGGVSGRDVVLVTPHGAHAEYWRGEAPEGVAPAPLLRLPPTALAGKGTEVELTVRGEGRRGLAVTLHADGGVAFLPHDLAAIEHLRASARNWLLILGGGLTLLGLVLATRFALAVSRPLETLIAATDRMRGGDLAARVDGTAMDHELGRLAQSFNGMAETVQTLVRDVSDKAARAEAANRAKDGFLASISHELRTPLTGIQSTAELLQQFGDQASPEERSEFVATILAQAERLAQRIGDAIEFASLVGNTTRWTVGRVDLLRVCEQACRRLDGLATLKHVDIQIVCEDGAVLQGDRERITQAVYHLVHNAWKWSPADSVIELHTRAVDGGFVVLVQDRGPGIAADERECIFESFGQGGEVLVDKPQGIGLGLAIVAEVAAMHGGSLDYRDRDGGGAAFSLLLRLRDRPIDRLDLAATAGTAPGTSS